MDKFLNLSVSQLLPYIQHNHLPWSLANWHPAMGEKTSKLINAEHISGCQGLGRKWDRKEEGVNIKRQHEGSFWRWGCSHIDCINVNILVVTLNCTVVICYLWRNCVNCIWNLCIISTYGSISQFSCSVESNSLRYLELQHARPSCPSPTPGVYSNSCSSSQWCHPAISSSVIPFSSRPQSLQAWGSFPISQVFTWGGQSIEVSTSASVLPKNTQNWSPLGWMVGSLYSSRVFSSTPVQKHQFFGTQLSSQSNSHIHTWPLEKP